MSLAAPLLVPAWAARVRETFASEVGARGRPLPRAWPPETVAAVP
jgi:hypothetical protein